MGPNDWAAIGIIVTIIGGWLAAIHKRVSILNNLPEKYVPREQIDARFYELERRWERESRERENRMERRFDELKEMMNRMISSLEGKADK